MRNPSLKCLSLLFLLHFILLQDLIQLRGQEKLNNDYFAADVDKVLLYTVEHYHLGDNFWNLYHAQEYNYAMGDMQYILRHYPNHPQALFMFSLLAQLQKKPALPITYFNNAITLFPQREVTRIQYADYLVTIDRPKEAIIQLQMAIKIRPNSAVAYASMADAYNKLGDNQLAAEAMKKAKELGYK